MSTASPQIAVSTLPEPGVVLDGQYILLRELGQGSFSVVYEAEQELLHRRVAVKVLRPEVVLLPGIAERFLREAQLASALSHENTATIYGVGIHEPHPDAQGLPFIAMERLHGESLHEYLEREGTLPPEEALELLLQVLDSLAEAHRLGIIHRDLKPENLWLSQRNGQRVVKVLDFGIAKAIGQDWSEETRRQLTQTGLIFGTPAFMSPEQALGKPSINATADVYAVACIGYLMLTGELLFPDQSSARIVCSHVSAPPPRLPELFGGAPINAIFHTALSKAPEDRYPDAGAFAHALRHALLPSQAALMTAPEAPALSLALDLAPPTSPPPSRAAHPTHPTLNDNAPPAPSAAPPLQRAALLLIVACTFAVGMILIALSVVSQTELPQPSADASLIAPLAAPQPTPLPTVTEAPQAPPPPRGRAAHQRHPHCKRQGHRHCRAQLPSAQQSSPRLRTDRAAHASGHCKASRRSCHSQRAAHPALQTARPPGLCRRKRPLPLQPVSSASPRRLRCPRARARPRTSAGRSHQLWRTHADHPEHPINPAQPCLRGFVVPMNYSQGIKLQSGEIFL